MIRVSLDCINKQSPYAVSALGDGLVFVTEEGIEYSVHFTEEFSIGGCDTSDSREASRNRLFANWFRKFAERGAYEFRSTSSYIEGEGFYAAIIVELKNPKLQSILEDFDRSAKELAK